MRKPVCGKTRGSIDVAPAVGVAEGEGEGNAAADGDGAGDTDAGRVACAVGVGSGTAGATRKVGCTLTTGVRTGVCACADEVLKATRASS